MRILVLGRQNKLGFHMVQSFSEDYDVFSWDRDDFDFLDFDILQNRIITLKPDLIINTISFDDIDRCENEKGLAWALKYNIDFVLHLAKISLEINSILMHFSCEQVFSGLKEKPFFLEDETANPINKYGETKMKGENELIRLGNRGLKYYLIRTSRLFGLNQDDFEEDLDFFKSLLISYYQGQKEFRIINEELANFTYVPDLAEASKRLWELKVPFGVYHLVNENPATWYEAAVELFSICKMPVYIRKIRSEDLLKEARRPKYSVLKNEKLKKLRPYNLALAEYLNQINNNL